MEVAVKMTGLTNKQTIAYLRVSTQDQDLEKNKMDILLFATEKNLGQVKFIEDKASGTISWQKRALASVIESLSEGDNLIVSEFSRLGRSMLECIEVISRCLSKKINLYAIKGSWKLDNSIQSKVMAMMFSIVSEIERDLISKRTSEALRARKEKGLPLGRPKGKGKSKLDGYKDEIFALLNNGSTYTFVAKKYDTSLGNLKHWLARNDFIAKG
ncbi:recombinase family protein [Cysteiniphilum halobium]|uniref:recombinase family protein n=1 Tax=Cysteiniphilum halobium TaxID=2219059 RepID=UPI001AAC6A8B|nr:recombinase family protein [Cysteiniphilum halobium]